MSVELEKQGVNALAVVNNWFQFFRGKINSYKQQGRDCVITLSMVLEGPERMQIAALQPVEV